MYRYDRFGHLGWMDDTGLETVESCKTTSQRGWSLCYRFTPRGVAVSLMFIGFVMPSFASGKSTVDPQGCPTTTV